MRKYSEIRIIEVEIKTTISCYAMSVDLDVTRRFVVETAKHNPSTVFHHHVTTPFWFFHTKRCGNILTGTP